MGSAPQWTRQLAKNFGEAIGRSDVAGLVAMAANRQGTFYEGAFGVADAESARAMSSDSMFRIASMTKPVTTVAALQLVDQGRLGLDDPAARHLPELGALKVLTASAQHPSGYDLKPVRGAVTVRQLLSHTSGFGYPFTSASLSAWKALQAEADAVDPLMFHPGEAWLYGRGTTWAGRLIERVTGTSLEEYFRDRIFRPLEMSDTTYFPGPGREERLVTVMRRKADGGLSPSESQPPVAGFTPNGCGGLTSTARDYIRFARMLLQDGELDGQRIISAHAAALMGQDQAPGVRLRPLVSENPRSSNDFSFIDPGRDRWGLGFLVNATPLAGRRAAGSLFWGGLNNTYFWVDRAAGIAGTVMMQLLPFADARALAVFEGFEREVYRDLAHPHG